MGRFTDYYNQDPILLAANVADMEAELKRAHAALAQKRLDCKHRWSEPKYDPIVHEAFHFAGDPPGTMGVDRQLPMDVPRREEPRWTRKCYTCLKVETTERTRDDVRKVPVF